MLKKKIQMYEYLPSQIRRMILWLVGRAVTRSSQERKIWDANLGLVKSDSVANGSPPLRHFLKKSYFAPVQ